MPWTKRSLAILAAGAFAVAAAFLAARQAAASRAGDDRAPRQVAARGENGEPRYAPWLKEAYLTEQEAEYVRPGVHATVLEITIPADRRPVVDFTLTDDRGQPLDRLGNVTPGPISVSFILAWWDPATRRYTSYTTRVQTSPITDVSATQASADSGGTFTEVSLGHYTYRFRTALPEGYDPTVTHTLGIYIRRTLTDIVGKDFFANVEHDFRPDGAPVVDTWDKISDPSCNTCHTQLAAHGGPRRDVKLCVLCHSPQTIDPDTGNTVDMAVMTHKIHMGEDLPSVQAGTPYVIIGNQQSVHDYSHVVFPQDIRNCTTCHAPPASQAGNWAAFPTIAACGACHDNVNFETGENHPAGPAADGTCASCHVPDSGVEFDASVAGAHVVPHKSASLAGLHAEIVDIENAVPGSAPTVRFRLTENDGTVVSPAGFGSNLNVLMGGPTSDYDRQPIRQRADGASFDGTTAAFTFSTPIPADATGTWAFSIEARRTVQVNGQNFTEGAFNPVAYAALTDAEPVARRMVVDVANCNACHDRLALHGGQRLNTQECVMCHNPLGDDHLRRPADENPPESISFQRMIHRIHTGEELTQDFTVYGFGNTPNNYNHIVFPGDRRACAQCHVAGSWNVPPGGILATVTLRDYYTPQQPAAAACLGCHDMRDSAAHAFVNTAPFGEACASCHGPQREFSVDRVHAR